MGGDREPEPRWPGELAEAGDNGPGARAGSPAGGRGVGEPCSCPAGSGLSELRRPAGLGSRPELFSLAASSLHPAPKAQALD